MCFRSMVLHGPPIILKAPRPPLSVFKGGPLLALESTNVQKNSPAAGHYTLYYFNSQFKNISPASGYYVITPFSENNMVNTVK